jgi:hypothetical protein
MKLISKNFDYYDTSAYTWQDHEADITFQRPDPSDLIPHTFNIKKSLGISGFCWDLTPKCIVFCGKVYPLLYFRPLPKERLTKSKLPDSPVAFYSFEEFVETFGSIYYNLENVKKFFNADFSSLIQELEINSCLYLLWENEAGYYKRNKDNAYLTLYPSLKKFQFEKMMDEQTCWQELCMFAPKIFKKPELGEVNCSDVIKAESHGFNKESFRNVK